jgi:uncharacterized protein
MPEYEAGVPIWVDLSTTDVKSAGAFYSGLFGWQAQDLGPEAGGYNMMLLNGKMAAGLGPTQGPGQPPAWSTYVKTEDAAATADKVKQAGGTVVMPPFDVMGQGHMGVFQDPGGAYFSVWQPGQHRGAEVVNDAGAFSWNELATRDIDGAKRFYAQVFGWGAETHGDYTEWKVSGRSVAGAMPMGDRYPPQVPPHWLVYFTVTDCDASAAKAQQLGGQVLVPPMDVEPGRFAVIQDPQGAVFGIIKYK